MSVNRLGSDQAHSAAVGVVVDPDQVAELSEILRWLHDDVDPTVSVAELVTDAIEDWLAQLRVDRIGPRANPTGADRTGVLS